MSTRINYQTNFDEKECLGDILFSNKSKYQNYPVISTPETLKDLKHLINNIIKSTENYDLKMGLNIIITLISHNKNEVVAYSLGKLYLLIQDESIRKLIVKELKKMRTNDNISVRKSAEDSMEIIKGEVNKYEIFELSYDIINYLICNLDNYLHPKLDFIPNLFFISKLNSKVKSKIKHSRLIESWNDMMYHLLNLMMILDNDLNILQLNEDDVDDYYLKNPDEPGIISYSEVMNLEITEESYINTLVDIYAMTFREKGHLNHLEALLDDDNYKIRQMGIVGLIYVLKVLTNFKEDKPYENLISEVLGALARHHLNIGSKLIKIEKNTIYNIIKFKRLSHY